MTLLEAAGWTPSSTTNRKVQLPMTLVYGGIVVLLAPVLLWLAIVLPTVG